MTRITFPLSVVAIALLGLLHVVPAQAQAIRVFVAMTGNDANPCTFVSPCKSVQHAHDVVAAGGEIRMLDPGSYGLLTITKAISILGDGHGGIAASNGATAITINAGANDQINLRGLVIEGFGSGQNGIEFNSGKSLSIEDCAVRHLANFGLWFKNRLSTAATLSVANSYFTDNNAGIVVEPTASGDITGAIDRVTASGNTGAGVSVYGGNGPFNSSQRLYVSVTDSVAANNGGWGFLAQSGGRTVGRLFVSRSAAVGNGIGIASIGGILYLAQSTVVGNQTSFSVTGVFGFIDTFQDNYIPDVSGSTGNLTPFTKS